MAPTEASELICLVCSLNVDLNSCTNIFYVTLPHKEEILADFVLKVLKLSTSDLRSSYVCLRCYNLFGILEQAQWTADNIQCEILKVFETSHNEKLSADKSLNEISTVNKLLEDFSEAQRLDQIIESKVITEHLSEKDLSSLNNITNDIVNNSMVIPNQIEINHSNESHVIHNDKESKPSYTSIKLSSNNKDCTKSYKTEAVNISEDTNIFSEEIIKPPDIENQKKFEWLDLENIPNLSNDITTESRQLSADPAHHSSTNQPATTTIHNQKQPSKPHTCTACDKEWRSAAELRAHERTHSSLRPYMCEKCGQAYKHKRALEIHVGLHNGVSPFQCGECGKCFTQKAALQRHLPIHTGDKPYQCELCGKRFVHHTSYNMHVLSHTGKKSYTCHVCNQSLLSTSHLKRHMRVHTGERPYGCQVCGKAFSERYNLHAHMRIHDEGAMSRSQRKLNRCDDCTLTFSTKRAFTEHLKQRHPANGKAISDATATKAATDEASIVVNGADLLDSCVNEVWQSLSKAGEKLRLGRENLSASKMIGMFEK